jgi:Ser-tRNA(Ala) deacylase AlaX
MNENEKQQELVTTESNYIEAIQELRANSVDKTAYEKVVAENKQLLNSLVKGETVDTQREVNIDIKALRNDLFNGENTNLDYISKSLQLRNELIKRGEKDPFLPHGAQIIPTEEDIATANRVASALQSCVDYADGDSNIFTTELQRIMVDSVPLRRR